MPEPERVKIFFMEECFQCPRFSRIRNLELDADEFWCNEKERTMETGFNIPDWCPLEDAPKKDGSGTLGAASRMGG